MKGHSGSKKRFKITATGKVLHKATGRRHNFSSKRLSRKRALRRDRQVNAADLPRIQMLLIHMK